MLTVLSTQVQLIQGLRSALSLPLWANLSVSLGRSSLFVANLSALARPVHPQVF